MLVLPVFLVQGHTLAEAWEKALLETWFKGTQIATQYDKPGDPLSRDASVVIVVEDAFAEPRIHRAFPGGIKDLVAYEMEVMDGIHDHWIDPDAGKWEYTYHDRLTAYRHTIEGGIDQIATVIDQLSEAPHTRRAQAITWQPWQDPQCVDPPCLQRMWFRVFDDELVMSVDMRSNDAFKAAFMNMYAFTGIQRMVAQKISEKLEREVRPTQYIHRADSFHIYGSYFDEFKGFLNLQSMRPKIEDRTWDSTEEGIAEMIEEARTAVRESLALEQETGRKGL